MNQAKILTPVITAFAQDGSLDRQGNVNLWNHVIAGGVDGVVLLGSAGEFCSMPLDQRKELVLLAAEHIKGRAELIVGTGGMDAGETIAFSNFALECGADAVMVVSPYYFALGDADVERFYDRVAVGVNGNIYLYSYPGRTGYDISPAATLSLLRRHKNIVGYKDSDANFAHTRTLLAAVAGEFPDFVVYSGFDDNMAHNLLSGGSGCIGGLSNIYPEVFAAWTDSINRRDLARMAELQKLVNCMMEVYEIGGTFMPVVRKAAQLRGVALAEHCTHPLAPVTPEQEERIRALIASLDEAIAALLSPVAGAAR